MELSATTDGGLELRTTGWFIKSHPKIKPKKGIKKNQAQAQNTRINDRRTPSTQCSAGLPKLVNLVASS